jgi:acid phosphatase type 7
MATSVLRIRLKSAIRVAGLGAEMALSSVRSRLNAARNGEPPPRDPYVQNVSASSAVIAWTSEEPDVGLVEYGKTPWLGRQEIDARVDRRHVVTLSELEPGSTYYYRAVGIGRPSEVNRFRTAPSGGSSSRFTFAVIGDSGDGGKNQLAVAALLERLKPDLILHTGDVVYPAGEERYYDRRFFVPYRRLIKEVPVFPALGNHDLEKNDGAAYLNNFHPPRNNPQATKRYYSFDWGNAHFVALNSELYHEDGSASPEVQKAWLERDLKETDRPWKFVFLHRPIYSSSNHGSDEKIREDLEPVLVRYGVNVVFSGHDHNYERTVPIGGVIYVVSAGGGKRLYRARNSEWTAFSKSVHHAVLVHVDGERLSLEAVEPNGTLLDRLELDRRKSHPPGFPRAFEASR